MISGLASRVCDSVACLLLNVAQNRWPVPACTREEIEEYLARCASASREDFYRFEPLRQSRWRGVCLEWESPIVSGFPENDQACARVFYSPAGRSAPTLFFLHALMSISDFGYVRIARRLQRQGWNVVVAQLPFHFSRTPHGFPSGALALSAHLPRNGETLRQAVIEIRQLMHHFRTAGCLRFSLIGTSYGGWIAAIIGSLEPQLEYLALLQPVTDLEQAIWQSPASRHIRRQLTRAQIPPGITLRHAHLSSPLAGRPVCDPDRVLIVAGRHDTITPLSALKQLQENWGGSRLVEVDQGHFGYRAMHLALAELARVARKS